jgi:hypothetical protein
MERTRWAIGLTVAVLALGAAAARAADPPPAVQKAVDKAVERGVAALRKASLKAGSANEIGAAALVGLTLLECDVGGDDKTVKAAAEIVRREGPGLKHTYPIALALLFLDRLGDPADEPLIEALTVRLLAGQNQEGSWCYNCPLVGGPDEERRLRAALSKRDDKDRPRPREGRRGPDDLPGEVKAQLVQIGKGEFIEETRTPWDESNTQFATLGLWVGRRHGLPVGGALDRLSLFQRKYQQRDGGWPYTVITDTSSTPTMTCAGLLGLVAQHGAAAEAIRDKKPGSRQLVRLGEDAALNAGLAALASCIDHPASKRKTTPVKAEGRAYYFLWSVERVAVALDLETIGGKDWWLWGAEALLVSQEEDGSWRGEFARYDADTCFALLFLRRSNLTRDLTRSLGGKTREVVLKAGSLSDKTKLKPDLEGWSKAAKVPAGPGDRPPPPPESAGAKLARQFLDAPGDKKERMLEEYREARGTMYTEAIAFAIPSLTGADKRQARDALAARLARMKAATLRDYLKDEEPEIRRAAAWACVLKDLRPLAPDLIELLEDREATVAQTAHAALTELTGQKIGPDAAEWKAWWAKQPRE